MADEERPLEHDLKADPAEVITFLKILRPQGPWVLTAIIPDGDTFTWSFDIGDAKGIAQFIANHGGQGRNIYFTGNPCGKPRAKPSKEAFTGAAMLHTDDDPRDGESPAEAKIRIKAAYEAHDPPPSIIIDSGNGLQGIWLLDASASFLAGDHAPIEERNRALALALGTQAGTHNIDRLLRLPGTINWPSASKRAKGRRPCRASLLKLEDIRYPLSRFALPGPSGPALAAASATDPSGHAGPSPSGLSDMLKALLRVEAPEGERSGLLFGFLLRALHFGLPDEAILAACLDPAYAGKGIHAHVQDKGGPTAERQRAYLNRQLARAKAKILAKAQPEPAGGNGSNGGNGGNGGPLGPGAWPSNGDPEEPDDDEPPDAPDTMPVTLRTDLGNARQLVRRFKAVLRYVPAWNSWLIWREAPRAPGSHWYRDDDGAVMRCAKMTTELMLAEAADIADEEARKKARLWAIASQNVGKLNAMVELARTELPVILKAERIDADPMLLGVRNGVIELETGTFRPARRGDYITKRAGCAYDPKATCPNWEAFLAKIQPDPEMVAYMQRVAGYTLTGLTAEEVMFLLLGGGANGKSTWREMLFGLMADYATGSSASLLMTLGKLGNPSGLTPDVAKLHGKRLVTINESQEGAILNEERVKFITGHDVITARDLYEKLFDFYPSHKAFVTTQHKPIIKGNDEGIWRRIDLWNFPYTFPVEERDKLYRERVLMPELPGILNWALAGLKDYLAVGLQRPACVANVTKEYRADMDTLGKWIAEHCLLDPARTSPTDTLYQDYKAWSLEEADWAMSKIGFGRALEERGFRKARPSVNGKQVRGWAGIALATG